MARKLHQHQSLTTVFQELIHGFTSRHCLLSTHSSQSRTVLYQNLLQGFLQTYARCRAQELREAQVSLCSLQELFAKYASAIEEWRKSQESLADDFSILEVLDLTGNEIRHSMVLAWLLDHDFARSGTHAQGRLGFKLFLAELSLPSEYADKPYWVRREVEHEEARVDIEIAARGSFLIHIENKIFSDEGSDQTEREWRDAARRAKELDVPCGAIHALFLTPNKRAAQNSNFRCITWSQMARVFDAFAAEAKPPDVKLFCTHYARALRILVPNESQLKEKENGEGTV
jgi:hypothetical protein